MSNKKHTGFSIVEMWVQPDGTITTLFEILNWKDEQSYIAFRDTSEIRHRLNRGEWVDPDENYLGEYDSIEFFRDCYFTWEYQGHNTSMLFDDNDYSEMG